MIDLDIAAFHNFVGELSACGFGVNNVLRNAESLGRLSW